MAAFSVYKEQIGQIVNHFENSIIVIDVIKILLNQGYSLNNYELSALNLLPLSPDLYTHLAINSSTLEIIDFNGQLFLNMAAELDYELDKVSGFSLVKIDDLKYERMLYKTSVQLFHHKKHSILSAIVDCFLIEYMTDSEYQKYNLDPYNFAPIFVIWSRKLNKDINAFSFVNDFSFHAL